MIGMALLLFADRALSMSSYVSRRFWFLGYKTDIVFYLMNKPQYAKTTNCITGSPLRLVFPAQFRKARTSISSSVPSNSMWTRPTTSPSASICRVPDPA